MRPSVSTSARNHAYERLEFVHMGVETMGLPDAARMPLDSEPAQSNRLWISITIDSQPAFSLLQCSCSRLLEMWYNLNGRRNISCTAFCTCIGPMCSTSYYSACGSVCWMAAQPKIAGAHHLMSSSGMDTETLAGFAGMPSSSIIEWTSNLEAAEP